MHKLSSSFMNKMKTIASYDPKDERLSKVLCASCLTNYNKTKKANDDTQLERLYPDYSMYRFNDRKTRSNAERNCYCTLCKKA